MALAGVARQARRAWGLRSFLRAGPSLEQAERALGERVARREGRFLAAMEALVWSRPDSPYLQLLRQAGCEAGDLEASVRSDGIEGTLGRLLAEGVRVSLEALKASPGAFDNAGSGSALTGRTSGSSSRPSAVTLTWPGLAEEAENELVLYADHGVERAPLALYLPGPPGLAGVRNVLVNARLGRPPDVWFDPSDEGSAADRAQSAALGWIGRAAGARLPGPVSTPPERVGEIVRWLADATRKQPRILSAFTSPALRVAASAIEAGASLDGVVLFATGEPVTAVRHRFLESAGLRCFARYVTAETGILGASCSEARSADDMHVWSDRVAVVDHGGALFVTSLSIHGGKVLVNVDLGDGAAVERLPCACRLGRLGLETRISRVHSSRRVTAEGASVQFALLDELVGDLVERAGGPPDGYQVIEERDGAAPARITVVVAPEVALADDAVVAGVFAGLRRGGPGARVAAGLWEQADILRVRRGSPQLTPGAKLPGVVAG